MQLIHADPGGPAGAVKFGTIEGTSFSDGTISCTFVYEDNMARK